MIIVSNKNMENSVYFERAIYTRDTDSYTVELVDRASNKTYRFEGLEDKRLVQYGFYTFFIDFSELPEGEYEYRLYSLKEREKEFLVPYGEKEGMVCYKEEIISSSDFIITYYNCIDGPQYMYVKHLDTNNEPFAINYFNDKDELFVINYFNDKDELLKSEIRYDGIESEGIISFNIPKSTSYYIVNNLKEEYSTNYFKPFVYLGEEEYELVGTGLIRLNELDKTHTTFYENKREYIVYDKQA